MSMEFKEKASECIPMKSAFDGFNEGFQNYRETSGTYDDIKLEKLECSKGGIIFAITLFNECSDAIRVSLAALADNIKYLYFKESNERYGNISIFIIADGIVNLAASSKDLLSDLGFPLPEFESSQDDIFLSKKRVGLESLQSLVQLKNDSHWFDIYHESLMHGDRLGASDLFPTSSVVQLVLCLKRRNAGKLDSHWWYYEIMCEHIDPSYCFQMDVGTCPANDATYQIWRSFEKHIDMAGASSSLYTLPPKSPFDWLAIWQYGDFARGSMFGIWNEVATGYVSVVPGQFSAFRWTAIKKDIRDGSQKLEQPLDVYFKGLGHLGPFDSAIYLTEDRVLCLEVVNKPGCDWKINHVETAVVITDPCKSWGELLKQRKRWNSGALLSKIAFMKSLPTFLSNSNNSFSQKINRIKSTVFHSIRALFDWLFLGVFLYVAFVFAQLGFALDAGQPTLHPMVIFVWAAMMLSISAQFLIFIRGNFDHLENKVLYFSVSVQVIICVVTAAFALYNNSELFKPISLLLALFLCLLLSLYFFNKKMRGFTKNLLKTGIQYSIISPSVSLMLWIYAVVNVHNNSWGTKGLDIPDYDVYQQERFLRFRKIYLRLWVVSNVLFGGGMYLAFYGGHINGISLLIMISILEGIIALVTFSRAMVLSRKVGQ